MSIKPTLPPGRMMIRTALLAACVAVFAHTALAAPKVVSSIMPVNALVGAVMEGLAVPQTLLPPGATPHAYALKPSDARMLAEADVIFWIGPELETFLEGPLETLAANARKVALIQSRGLLLFEVRTLETFEAQSEHEHGHKEEYGHKDEHGHKHDHGSEEHGHDSHGHDHAEGSIDGHIWLDPANAQIMIRAIAETLIQVDPANADRYRRNAEAAMAFTADTWARVDERLEPLRSLRFVTYHDAFQYFEAAFGLTNVGVVAINSEAPPGAKAIKRLRERIQSEGATCALFEPQYDGRAVHALTRDLGLGFSVLDPMGPLAPPGVGQYRRMLMDMAEGLERCTGS